MNTIERPEESIESRIRGEKIRLLFQQTPVLFVGIVALIIATTWYLWEDTLRVPLVIWCTANSTLTALRVALVVAYRRSDDASRQRLVWPRVSTAMSGISGLLWGSLALWALQPGSAGNVVFIVTVLTSMTAASLVALGSWLISYFAYTITSMILLSVGLLFAGGAEFLLLAVLIVVFMCVNSFFATTINRNIVETLRLRFQNLELLQDLKVQKEVAEQANLDKSRFLASASHDLRQPLHALDLFVCSLANTTVSEEQKSLLENVQVSSKTLSELLNALLDVSRVDAGDVQTDINSFPITPLLHSVTADCRSRAAENNLQLRVRGTDINVRSDQTLLGRILRNLISNAVRYTKSGGVLVGCRRRGDMLRIEVWDTGPGIPDSERDKIFSEFYQLGNKERNRRKGLGLGLAIVKRCSILLGLSVTVSSQLGRGSCFCIEVPIAPAMQLDMPSTADQEHGYDIAGTFVLIIEDDEQVREGMRHLLRDWHCELLLSEDVLTAIRELSRSNYPTPEIVVTDFRLAGELNGIESVRHVRAHFGKHIPAIVVTGDTSDGIAGLARAADCGILYKPLNPPMLRAAISSRIVH